MKSVLLTLAALGAMSLAPAAAQDCANADPAAELIGLAGDFELVVDPQDPKQNLIWVTHAHDGASPLVVGRIDGRTGQVINGSLSTIADNFYGQRSINGPEFVQKPTGELGILYAGVGGVRAVFRANGAVQWNAFYRDFDGNKVPRNNPPLLPGTSDGAYPAPPIPFGQSTFGQYRGDCPGICYGFLDGPTTDIVSVFAEKGLTATFATQGIGDGQIYATACNASGSCGLYEGWIDGRGGFVKHSVKKLAVLGRDVPVSLAVTSHPLTNSTLLFVGNGSSIDVWEQPGPWESGPAEQASQGGPVQLRKSIPAAGNSHFRTLADSRKVVLHFLTRSGSNAGSYTVPVSVEGGAVSVGVAKRVTNIAGGVELIWMPAANSWAAFYRTATQTLRRCWVTP